MKEQDGLVHLSRTDSDVINNILAINSNVCLHDPGSRSLNNILQ